MDYTVAAIPVFFGTMEAEHLWLRAHASDRGPTPADYERNDTITSLTMGTASLAAPFITPIVLRAITPGSGRHGRRLLALAGGAVVVTTVADVVVRRERERERESALDAHTPVASRSRRRVARVARRVASAGGVVAVVAGGLAVTTTWASRTTTDRFWKRRVVRDLGTGPLALAAAIAGWDFIYYWNHRFMHESRYMWAVHVVHHSSERYNLSTALRQPVADVLGTFVPYGLLALVGVRPELIDRARDVNLLYQYWIHTDAIRSIGPGEELLNTPSHHRVHHGRNRRYIDRNHGSIFIVWDRLFGTFQREEPSEPVVYGLTKNINTFNPLRVAAHEHFEMLRDVARGRSWRERLSFVLRGPGWAYSHEAGA